METKPKRRWRTPSVVLWMFAALLLAFGIGAVSSVMGGIGAFGISGAVVIVVYGVLRAGQEDKDNDSERNIRARLALEEQQRAWAEEDRKRAERRGHG